MRRIEGRDRERAGGWTLIARSAQRVEAPRSQATRLTGALRHAARERRLLRASGLDVQRRFLVPLTLSRPRPFRGRIEGCPQAAAQQRYAPAQLISPLLCAVVLLVGQVAFAFPWSTDMYRGESVQPLALPPRVMPVGTLPVQGDEPPMPREEAARVLRNPLQLTLEQLQHGQRLFQNICATCHGTGGRGDGPVRFQTILPPADLTGGIPTQRTDGYIYATIRNGGIVMPGYGDTTSAEERWELVLYVRALQRNQPVPPAPLATPARAAEPRELPPGTGAAQ